MRSAWAIRTRSHRPIHDTLYSLVESAKRANVEPAAFLDLAARAAIGGGIIPLPHEVAASL
jgi:hypothetical protein